MLFGWTFVQLFCSSSPCTKKKYLIRLCTVALCLSHYLHSPLPSIEVFFRFCFFDYFSILGSHSIHRVLFHLSFALVEVYTLLMFEEREVVKRQLSTIQFIIFFHQFHIIWYMWMHYIGFYVDDVVPWLSLSSVKGLKERRDLLEWECVNKYIFLREMSISFIQSLP